MRTRDLESLTNSAVQNILAQFRTNRIPEPWGEAYVELRNNVRESIRPTLENDLAKSVVNETRLPR